MADRVSTLGIVANIDFSGARAEYERFRAEVTGNPLTIPTGGGGRGFTFGGQSAATGPTNAGYASTAAIAGGINGQSGNQFIGGGGFNVGGGGGGNVSFNTAVAQFNQSITSFTQAVANFTSSVSNVTNVGGNVTNAATTNVANVQYNYGRGGGGAGGGGGGRNNFFRRGFGRLVSAYFVAREAAQVIGANAEYENDLTLAGNDVDAQYAAQRSLRQRAYGGGIVGGIVRLINDPFGRGEAVEESQIRAGRAGENSLAARTAFQAYEREVRERADVANAPESQRRVLSAVQAFDAAQRERREQVNTVTAAARARLLAQETSNEAIYQAEKEGPFESVINPTAVVAARNARELGRRDQANLIARNNYSRAVSGLSAELPGDQLLPAGRSGPAAEVSKAIRDQTQELRHTMSDAIRTTAAATALSVYSGEVIASGGGPNFQAEQALVHRRNQAEQRKILDTQGLSPAFNARVATDEADEALAASRFKFQQEDEAIVRRSSASINRRILADDPLGAQRARTEGERQRAVRRLQPGDIAGRLEVDALAAQEDQIAGRRFLRDTAEIGTTLSAQTAALRSGLRREPGAAGEAYTIGGEGLNAARKLIYSGRGDLAKTSEQNTLLQLSLLQQHYFDAFRGVQVDTRLIATQGGRQSEDPATVTAAIDKAKAELIQGIKDAFKEAIAGN